MSKVTRALALVVVTTIVLGSPMASQAVNAATLTPASQIGQVSKASPGDKAKFEIAVQRTKMAFERSKGERVFAAAVKAKDAAVVKRILIKNGADPAIGDVIFKGPAPGAAEKLKITVTGSYPPLKLTITISF